MLSFAISKSSAKQLKTFAGIKGCAAEIPWRQIARMRDKIIHHYFGLDMNLVWVVVETISALQEAI